MSNYSQRTAEDAGQLAAESEAMGRLGDLAEEYAGTEIGAEYLRQWEALRAERRAANEANKGKWYYTPEIEEDLE